MNFAVLDRLLAVPDRLDRIEAFLRNMRTDMNANEKALIEASDALVSEVDALGSAFDASLAKIDDLTAKLAAKTAAEDTPDEVAQIQAETAKLRGKADAVRSKVAGVQDAKSAADSASAPAIAPADERPVVGLEGVPVTPVSSTVAGAGPAVAVPSTDHTGSEVNAATSDTPPNASTSDAPVTPAAPAAAAPIEG